MLARARAVSLTNYHEVARFVGLDPCELLARAGIPPKRLDHPDNWLPAAKVLALVDDSAARSGRDDFGVLLASCRTFTSLGPVSLLMKHEATVGEIILAAVEYKHLVNDLLHITLSEDDQLAIVEWSLIPGLNSAQGINLVAAIAYHSISEAMQSRWEPDCIHFRHEAPQHAATFSRHFRCPLEFGSSFDGMSCSSRKIRMPNPFADADLARYARGLLNLLPSVRQHHACDKVRSVLLLLIVDGHASAERVAECLGVEVRTLQRRLFEEGSSFSQLLNETRRDLAIRYLLNSSLDLTRVSQLAGFGSLSAFTRWFTASFGLSPKAWRKKMVRTATLTDEPANFTTASRSPRPTALTIERAKPTTGVPGATFLERAE